MAPVVFRQLHIAVPEEGGHDQSLGLLVQGQQDDAVGQLAFFALPGVLTDDQDVHDFTRLAVIRLGGRFGGCLGRFGCLGDRVGGVRVVQVADEGGQILTGNILLFKLCLGHLIQLGLQEEIRRAEQQRHDQYQAQNHDQHDFPRAARGF